MGETNTYKLEGKSKIKILNGINMIAFILSMMAGWVDAVGIKLFLYEDSAFMTGRAKALGYYASNLDFRLFGFVFIVIIAFIIGSFFSVKITKMLGLKGGLILTGMFIIISSIPGFSRYMGGIFLPMAMGCQNGATSLTPINRTTHLTGPITDLGINIAKKNWDKVIFWTWRLIGFPLGAFIGFNSIKIVNKNSINPSIILIIPAVIIILTGVIQEKTLDIPLLN